jgi:hypothetical protein
MSIDRLRIITNVEEDGWWNAYFDNYEDKHDAAPYGRGSTRLDALLHLSEQFLTLGQPDMRQIADLSREIQTCRATRP